jgi:hypothetical protein
MGVAAKLSWLGSIVTIIGFFYIQLKIDELPRDWFHTFLFLASVFAETYVLWLWNSHDLVG